MRFVSRLKPDCSDQRHDRQDKIAILDAFWRGYRYLRDDSTSSGPKPLSSHEIIMATSKNVADIKLHPDADGSMDSSSQSLCLTCGLCCDGAIFSCVKLKPDDEITPLKAVGINIYSDSDANMFKLPCAAHKNCTCTVYANRPKDCRLYKCELLKRFERDDISHEAALEIINKVVSLNNEVNALALAASINTQFKEEVTLLEKRWLGEPPSIGDGATKQGHAHDFLKFGALQVYLDRFFREKPAVQAVAPSSERRDSEGHRP
jgi:hypothetical protein